MTLKLERLRTGTPIVNPDGSPTLAFIALLDRVFTSIETNDAAQQAAIDAIAAAQDAADAANAAAVVANDAAEAASNQNELSESYVTGLTISATDAGSNATISISAHTRHYPQPDGTETTVSVNSGTLTARAYSTSYWIYYDDATRAGGAVTYQSTTTQATAAQIGDRHFVGAVTTPAALGAAVPGKTLRAPGTVEP